MRVYEFLDFRAPTKKSLIILCSVASIAFSLSYLIHVRVQQALVGYTIAEREDEVRELRDRLKQLKLEEAVLKRPERIQRLAHEWFDMRYSHE